MADPRWNDKFKSLHVGKNIHTLEKSSFFRFKSVWISQRFLSFGFGLIPQYRAEETTYQDRARDAGMTVCWRLSGQIW